MKTPVRSLLLRGVLVATALSVFCSVGPGLGGRRTSSAISDVKGPAAAIASDSEESPLDPDEFVTIIDLEAGTYPEAKRENLGKFYRYPNGPILRLVYAGKTTGYCLCAVYSLWPVEGTLRQPPTRNCCIAVTAPVQGAGGAPLLVRMPDVPPPAPWNTQPYESGPPEQYGDPMDCDFDAGPGVQPPAEFYADESGDGGDPSAKKVRCQIYPTEDQREVPLEYARSDFWVPTDADAPMAGYPITLWFNGGQSVTKVQAKLWCNNDADLPFSVFTPEDPANKNYAAEQRNCVCILPDRPLKQGATYRVVVTAEVDGSAWRRSWAFHTKMPPADPPVADYRATRDDTTPEELAKRVLSRINYFRKAVGVGPVKLGASYSAACRKHAEYLAANAEDPSVRGRKMGAEDKDKPGYTAEGDWAARGSLHALLAPSVIGSVDEFMAKFYARLWILDPELEFVGIGFAKVESRWMVVVHVADR